MFITSTLNYFPYYMCSLAFHGLNWTHHSHILCIWPVRSKVEEASLILINASYRSHELDNKVKCPLLKKGVIFQIWPLPRRPKTHLTPLQTRPSFWRLVPLVWSCGRSRKLSRAPPRWLWGSSGRKARRTGWCTPWGLPRTDARGSPCVSRCWRARCWGASWADPAEPSPASPSPAHRGKAASQSHPL